MKKTEVSDNSKAITFIINSSSAVEKIELSTTHNITAKPSAKNKKVKKWLFSSQDDTTTWK